MFHSCVFHVFHNFQICIFCHEQSTVTTFKMHLVARKSYIVVNHHKRNLENLRLILPSIRSISDFLLFINFPKTI